ncbi:MAG TPA: TlpA disulfide reductase family protein [Chitinophagaceae bacterium]|nr:TlpA disulfide reductase family protein [Chitinophagaceae bacterium]
MKPLIKNLLLLFLVFSGLTLKAQEIKAITFAEFEERSKSNNDTIYIFNFWATWCKPCVAELPHFDKIAEDFKDKKVKVVFISLDNALQKLRVENFIKERNLKSEVVLMKDTNYNDWIDKVDPSWSGAIPATLVVNNKAGSRKFHEGDLNYEELKQLIITDKKQSCDEKF